MKKKFKYAASVRNLQPSRSMFDLSYEKKFDCDPGELIPVMADEVVPGDLIKLATNGVVRFAPLVAPMMHDVKLYVHYFFVPYRLLWNHKTQVDLSDTGTWEEFITGGEDGEDASVLPRWDGSASAAYSLWDYFGFPLITDLDAYTPIDFPRRAYNLIYNEYYRDENLIEPIALNSVAIQKRAWKKDYFTSSLPWQQRGIAPALPISGFTNAEFSGTANWGSVISGNPLIGVNAGASPAEMIASDAGRAAALDEALSSMNTVDLSVASTFDIADLRLAFQIQKWLERNARSGVRYTEFLKAHFGVSPRDDRLDRPEYIGGTVNPIVISEVLQTSQTDSSPQGNLAGHGLGVNMQFVGKYHVSEYGLIMGILSIMPKAVYQQGINRQWMRRTKYDFYFPEFCNLSEQAIENGEIFVTEANDTVNTGIFGYQGRYDEMRIKHDMVVAGMRDTFDYWHMSRQFPSLPSLNQSFIECVPRKDCFAAPSEKCCFVSLGNLIQAFRPLPIIAEPGLIDHN